MKLIQLLGGHAVGKSSTLTAIIAKDSKAHRVETGEERPLIALPSLKGVVIGGYPGQGLDAWWGVSNDRLMKMLQQAMGLAAKWEPFAWCAWEGTIVMSKPWHVRYFSLGLAPRYVHLACPISVSLQRMQTRSGTAPAEMGKDGLGRVARTERFVAWVRTQGAPVLELSGLDSIASNASHVLRWALMS